MVDRNAQGARGEPFAVEVERGKIGEFTRAIHTTHPAYEGPDAVIPPTFLSTTLHWDKRVADANPWALVQMSEERGMHAEQEYVFHGPPPRAGDRLHAQATITEIYDKESRSGSVLTFVKMVTEFRDDSGRLVAESILTGVERQLPETDQ